MHQRPDPADGTWLLDWTPPGRVWFDVDDGVGRPSRWLTLRALRVLRWWEGEGSDLGGSRRSRRAGVDLTP